jgi:hypothetical protein
MAADQGTYEESQRWYDAHRSIFEAAKVILTRILG